MDRKGIVSNRLVQISLQKLDNQWRISGPKNQQNSMQNINLETGHEALSKYGWWCISLFFFGGRRGLGASDVHGSLGGGSFESFMWRFFRRFLSAGCLWWGGDSIGGSSIPVCFWSGFVECHHGFRTFIWEDTKDPGGSSSGSVHHDVDGGSRISQIRAGLQDLWRGFWIWWWSC